jgi:hypothetical protein
LGSRRKNVFCGVKAFADVSENIAVSMENAVFCGVALVRSDVSEESIATIIKVKIINDVGTTDSFRPDGENDMFLRNVGPYKSHVASHHRRRHSSYLLCTLHFLSECSVYFLTLQFIFSPL